MTTPTDRRYRQGHRLFNAFLVIIAAVAVLVWVLPSHGPDRHWLTLLASFIVGVVCSIAAIAALAGIASELAKPCRSVEDPPVVPPIPRAPRDERGRP